MFARLHNLLKLAPDCQSTNGQQQKSVDDYTNIFYPICPSLQEPGDDDEADLVFDNDRKKVSTANLVFLWGFSHRVTASRLKRLLRGTHPVLSEDFELQFVDKTCSVIVLSNKDASQALLKAVELADSNFTALREMISDGLKGAGYEAYKKVCKLGLWEGNLADSLEAVLAETESEPNHSGKDDSEIYWNSELMINLDDL